MITAALFCAAVLASTLVVAGAVKVTWKLECTVEETLSTTTTPYVATDANRKVTHTGLNVSRTYDANSAPDATLVVTGKVTMVAGAGSINLAAVPGTQGTVDLTGKKIRTILFRAAVANVNPITVAKGAANGYTGLGAAFSLTLDPGRSQGLEPNTVAVAAGVRLLDVTGTGAQELEFIITAGAN